jgi:hypothetical protein
VSVSVWDGTVANPAEVYVWDGSSGHKAASVETVAWGSVSVEAMLSVDTFYWAHRGGSAVWPEMSLWSYTQSAVRGVHAFEVSLARTSDGVWFGLHDETINRTSVSAPLNSVASSMTWAQVQRYRIDYRAPSQPYMRLEDICDAYGSSHVLVLDPKYQLFKGAEMLDLALERVPPTRLIGKYSGMTDNTSFVSACRARGVKTWGYFYNKDLASIPSKQGQWDFLGMEWDAPQATWDSILSYRKPVIAHIVPTRVAADVAVAKGAHGCQISNPMNVLNPIRQVFR